MESKVEINTEELKEILDKIFDFIQKKHGDSIVLEEDYYWKIKEGQKFIFDEKPSEFIVGSLFDEVNQIKKSLDKKNYPASTNDLQWFSAILDCISER